MSPQKFECKFFGNVWAKPPGQYLALTIAHEDRIPISTFNMLVERDGFVVRLSPDDVVESRAFASREPAEINAAGPNQVLLKSMLCQRARLVIEIIDLPFAGDARGIASVTQETRKNNITLRIKAAAAVQRCIVMQSKARTMRITPREQNSTAWSAYRRRVAVFDPHSCSRQPVDIWSASFLASVAAKPLLADIVEQNENNVRSWRFLCKYSPNQRREQDCDRNGKTACFWVCQHAALIRKAAHEQALALRNDLADRLPEFFFQSLAAGNGEPAGIQAKLMQNGCVNVGNVVAVFHGMEA